MSKRMTSYDQICQPENLLAAFTQVRKSRGAPGIDRISLAVYEQDLPANIDDLALRLREGRYVPMPLRSFELKKTNGGVRKLGILTVEDRIVQRAALNALEPLWEPSFLDCSFGFRPARSTAMAVQRILDFRAAGDVYVVDADITACFDSLDHGILMNLISQRERDKRMLNLIRRWLDTGQVLPKTEMTSDTLYDRMTSYVTNSMDGAVSHLLNERGYDSSYDYGYANDDLYAQKMADPGELQQQARKETLKRLGKDGALLALTYAARLSKLVSPTTLAITGAMVVASAAYPYASRKLRERYGPRPIGAVQGGALSPLFANIYLHELDKVMMQAGLHFVRYADDFVICCRDEKSAKNALALAQEQLRKLHLQIHPQKTRLTRFAEGLEFLGYKFAQFQCTAHPISEKNSLPALKAMTEVRDKVVPLAEKAAQQTKHGVAKLTAFLKRKGETNE